MSEGSAGQIPPQNGNQQPPTNVQQQFRPPPVVNVPPPSASFAPPGQMDPYLLWFQQQQQSYVAELFRQQQEVMQQQQQSFMAQQEQLIRSILTSIQVQVPSNPEAILDSLASNIKEFRYDPENNVTFAVWYSRYEDLFEKDASRLDGEAKVRLLMRKLGMSEHERYVSFVLPKAPKEFDFPMTVKKLSVLFGAAESVISRRYRCLQISKQPQEDYVSYACRINKSCVEFELSKLSEEQFKCLVFVCGLKSDKDAEVRLRLLSKIEERNDVTLEQLSEECQRLLNLRHDTAMIEEHSTAVNALRTNQQRFKSGSPSKFHQSGGEKSGSGSSSGKASPEIACWLCGGMHYARECSYRTSKCSDCGKVGHKTGYCRSAAKVKPRRWKQNVASTKVVTVNSCSVQQRRKYVPVGINGSPVRLQIDTGSDITIISSESWRKIGSPSMTVSTVVAKSASGRPLQIEGEFTCDLSIDGRVMRGTVRVTKEDLHLLGSDMIDVFGLWSVPLDSICNRVSSTPASVSKLQAEFPRVFAGSLGLCKKTKVQFQLKTGVTPVFRPKRPVAYAMYQAVDNELDRLERAKIITPVDFSEWAAPIVVVRKANGKIRICGDYSTGLNEALQPHQYPLPLPQDIFANLANCTVFSQIDLTDAFLQVEVDEGSRNLLTINTHRGLYRYNRLPPGVKAAPGAFQQLIDTMLVGLKGVSGYLDDIVVGGVDEEDHNRNLRAVLQRIQEFGFTIRAEKCSFGKSQIRYLGHLCDRHGIRPDPAKIEAIQMLPAPKDVSGVRSFLGAINYYGKFVPNMRTLRFPLDELLKEKGEFRWTAECQRSFERFKEILGSDLLLTHYDPRREIIVSADASSIGVGATISHRFPDGSMKVVQHAARALTKAEMGYSQPDREGLAVVFAVTKFHKMIFGRKFRLQTDHAPLVRIFGSRKGIPVYTANRLQRWALTLLLYDFTIEYVQTEKFGNADVLSRLINNHAKPDEDYVIASVILEEDLRFVADEAVSCLPLSFKSVEQETQSDEQLRKVYRYLREGWPEEAKIVDPEIRRLHGRRDSLCTVGKCIMFGECLVIPEKHRQRCLRQLHRGHPGILRMKALARSYVYWPLIDEEIAQYVKACKHCASVARSPPKEAPVPWPRPTGPWKRVHVDYAGPIDGVHYLLAVDAHSKWPEVVPTQRITSTATISILRSIFARLGMPETLVSDNGTQFTSSEFQQFCSDSGIDHVTTAPFHPQSNGQAERFVDTFKRALKKIQEGKVGVGEALDVFLLTYRTTPNRQVDEGKSPSEAMFGRRIRTSLDLLRPPPERPPSDEKEGNRRSFSAHDAVYAKVYSNNKWRWAPGTVCEKIGKVMYTVWVEDQRMVRAHVNQMRSRGGTTPGSSRPQSALPLDVLLDAWSIPRTAPPVPTPSLFPTDPTDSSREFPPLPPVPSASSSVSTSMSSSSSSSMSATSASPEFASADSEPVTPVQLPRRSSRARRPPQWFDPYHLY
ncbi:uncharacterized protein K02A2.6-like [Aedes albopictus]|uniref:RNA-directed DNA polymerase n=1 Tax=Aedes albopictus TaxID=7160 RepID=A0ABM1YNT4_AEDAL